MRAAMMLGLGCLLTGWACAGEPVQPARRGTTFYVSKLGDNSTGLSWATAFTTIQAGLDAIPDTEGGHRIVVRPDTYLEAMLSPAHSGAPGSYNELVGDYDGQLGSGTSGHVIIDAGDPAAGFKSYDWWGPIRATLQGWSPEHTDPTFSAIVWDRWKLSHLYVTGGDGGLFWDCTNRVEPFTVVVEDCISLGRAFGGGVASCLSRADEPITFRRCALWSLDMWGDTAGGYVRVENTAMPERPDVVFEDCTLVSPQCALKGGNYGYHTFTRVLVKDCRLIALNFSQPAGTPIDGIIQSVQNGKYLHVDLVDSTLMGYKVLGVKVDQDSVDALGYTTTGAVQAYVQFQQEVPPGFFRLQQWPAAVFEQLIPPAPCPPRPVITNVTRIRDNLCELAPVVWHGRLCHLECIRPASGGQRDEYYLRLCDVESGDELARFATGYSLACALVHDDTFYAFASRRGDDNSWNDVTMFKSTDLQHWESQTVIDQENEHLFNSSVCASPDGFVMAYESNDPAYPPFTIKFATSPDLEHWTKLPDATFGTNRYTACPCLRYAQGYYYVLYLEQRTPRHYFETYVTRTPDLRHWELSAANPVLAPVALDDGINASDPELVEFGGKTYIYFAVGDQLTWMNIKRRELAGSQADFFARYYQSPGVPDVGVISRR